MKLHTTAAEQTRELGRRLGRRLAAGDWVVLYGPLGAGKTTFAAGVAEGLGIREPVTSPTYLLCHEYAGPVTLLHLDAYFELRMDSVLAEGLAERLQGPVVVLVEWAEKMRAWLPPDRIEVSLAHRAEGRELVLQATGPRSRARLEGLEGVEAFLAP